MIVFLLIVFSSKKIDACYDPTNDVEIVFNKEGIEMNLAKLSQSVNYKVDCDQKACFFVFNKNTIRIRDVKIGSLMEDNNYYPSILVDVPGDNIPEGDANIRRELEKINKQIDEKIVGCKTRGECSDDIDNQINFLEMRAKELEMELINTVSMGVKNDLTIILEDLVKTGILENVSEQDVGDIVTNSILGNSGINGQIFYLPEFGWASAAEHAERDSNIVLVLEKCGDFASNDPGSDSDDYLVRPPIDMDFTDGFDDGGSEIFLTGEKLAAILVLNSILFFGIGLLVKKKRKKVLIK